MSGLNSKHVSLANSLCNESPYLQRLSHLNPQQLMSNYKKHSNRPVYHKKHRSDQDNSRKKYYTKWEMHQSRMAQQPPSRAPVPAPATQDQSQTIKALQQQIQQLQSSINMLQKQQQHPVVQQHPHVVQQHPHVVQQHPVVQSTSAYAAFKEPRMDSGMWYGRNGQSDFASSAQDKINGEKFELESYMEDDAIGGVDLSSAFK